LGSAGEYNGTGQLRLIEDCAVKNMPIIVKFLAVLGAFGLFALLEAGFSAWEMQGISKGALQVQNTTLRARSDLALASRAIQSERAAIEWQLITINAQDDAQASAEMHSARATFDSEMSDAVPLSGTRANDIQALQQRGDNLIDDACAKTIQMAGASTTVAENNIAQAEFLANCQPPIPQLLTDIETTRQGVWDDAQTAMQALAQNTQDTIRFTLGLMVVGLIMVALGGFFGIRAWIVQPLATLRGSMERLARGELNLRVDTARRDELGTMGGAVMVFRDQAEEKLRLEKLAAAAQAQAEAERTRGEAAREATAAEQAQVVESVADGLERLSAGDLLYRLTNAFAPEYEKLRGDFNQAVEILQKTMQSIAANTHGVRSGAAEITKSSDDLARRTEQQAASLEETAAALDEITATVGKTATGASEARDVVNNAKTDAERSGAVVEEAVTAMQGIETSSKQISNIIGVIDEIAFQTNLLALNAGVEAARAGDAGRGFAVVATEVRALAQRSADAAKEIKTLISASGAQVSAGVKLVGETGNALNRIVEQVNRLSVLIRDIASSAQEQATGLAEVNSAVNQMDQVTQHNAAMVEESTAASHALAAEAEELAKLVAQFRIGEAAGRAAPRVERTPPPKARRALSTPGHQASASAPSTASRLPAAKIGKFVALPGGAAPDAGDWDEF